jgi:hypothetical protein
LRFAAVLLVVGALAVPAIAKQTPTASCSVDPNPTQITHDPNASPIAWFTISATSSEWFYLELTDPNGTEMYSGPYAPGSATWTWNTPNAGSGAVGVVEVRAPSKTIGVCAFTVLA